MKDVDTDTWKGRIAKHIYNLYQYPKKPKDIFSEHFFKLNIDELLWHSTTMILTKAKMVNIKYVGQRYWSEKAIEKYCTNNPEGTRGFKNCKGLIHEHAVPRKLIKTKILNILKIDENECINEIRKILELYSFSVIMTKDEAKKVDEKYKDSFKISSKDGTKEVEFDIFECKRKIIDEVKKTRYNELEITSPVVDIDEGKEIPYDKTFKDVKKIQTQFKLIKDKSTPIKTKD